MKTNNSTWESFNHALDGLHADENLDFTSKYPFTAAMVSPLSDNTEMMKIRVSQIKAVNAVEPNSIIEFGGAYGNLGATYQEIRPSIEYTLVETKSMLKFAEVFFKVKKKKAVLCAAENMESVLKEHDLFCTYCAISETPEEYQNKVFETFLPSCKSAMIIEVPSNVPKYSSVLEKYYETIKILDSPAGHSDKHMIIFATDLRK
jgi:hypothetical protein